eukprot:scaffold416917_cov19-Prasinocladus_malaysianus.AAC.1
MSCSTAFHVHHLRSGRLLRKATRYRFDPCPQRLDFICNSSSQVFPPQSSICSNSPSLLWYVYLPALQKGPTLFFVAHLIAMSAQ